MSTNGKLEPALASAFVEADLCLSQYPDRAMSILIGAFLLQRRPDLHIHRTADSWSLVSDTDGTVDSYHALVMLLAAFADAAKDSCDEAVMQPLLEEAAESAKRALLAIRRELREQS